MKNENDDLKYYGFACYTDNSILTRAELDLLRTELNEFTPSYSMPSMSVINMIIMMAYKLKLIVPKQEYDNQVQFNKILKQKLNNIDK